MTVTVPEIAAPRRRPTPRPPPGAHDTGGAVQPRAAALPVAATPAGPDPAGVAASAPLLTVEQLAHLLARSAWATGGALLLDVATGATLAYVAGDTIPMPVHLGALYAGVLAAAATLAAVLCRAHLLRPDLPPTSDQERAA